MSNTLHKSLLDHTIQMVFMKILQILYQNCVNISGIVYSLNKNEESSYQWPVQ